MRSKAHKSDCGRDVFFLKLLYFGGKQMVCMLWASCSYVFPCVGYIRSAAPAHRVTDGGPTPPGLCTFGAVRSSEALSSVLTGHALLPRGPRPALDAVLPRRPRGPGPARRSLHVGRLDLRDQVGQFGCARQTHTHTHTHTHAHTHR